MVNLSLTGIIRLNCLDFPSFQRIQLVYNFTFDGSVFLGGQATFAVQIRDLREHLPMCLRRIITIAQPRRDFCRHPDQPAQCRDRTQKTGPFCGRTFEQPPQESGFDSRDQRCQTRHNHCPGTWQSATACPFDSVSSWRFATFRNRLNRYAASVCSDMVTRIDIFTSRS